MKHLTTHWRTKDKLKQAEARKPVQLRRVRQRVVITANWDMFYDHFERDHSRADLIWNFKVCCQLGAPWMPEPGRRVSPLVVCSVLCLLCSVSALFRVCSVPLC